MRLPTRPAPWRDVGVFLFTGFSLIPQLHAITFKSTPSPNLDLSGLGSVALAGNFDSVSLYNYIGQNEDGLSANGSQSLLGRFPSGGFTDLLSSDAYIQSMCSFVASDGTLNGVVVGGNFTSLGGQEVQAIALYNPVKNSVTPLPGLTGQVNSVYCDTDSQTVYVGGMFSGGNSTNAIAWVNGWTNLPFAGFNGPVTSVSKLPNGNILFAGQFTGIGKMVEPQKPNAQVVNVGAATLTVSGKSNNPPYGNASNIICTTPGESPRGTNFIFEDNFPGSLQADFPFEFTPSKLRLYNSQVPGYATKTWRFTYLPAGGILNFTYFDENGHGQSCTNECPLAKSNSYQDFFFVNQFPVTSFRIDISEWYGKGAGLGGLELFQNDIYSFAPTQFNEPKCDDQQSGATSSHKGKWELSAPGLSNTSEYLTTSLPDGTLDLPDISVTFLPKVLQSGNYKIDVYTPGCIPDQSCYQRGSVNITGTLTSGTNSANQFFSYQVSQTNWFDKYEEVYLGYVEADNGDFRPSFTLTPTAGQGGNLTVVAQKVQLTLMSTSDGLNGLFEYNPNQANVDTSFGKSVVDRCGTTLNDDALVLSVAVDDTATYAAGAFSSESVQNILSFSSDKCSALAHKGLNDVVQALIYSGDTLYTGGNFTATADHAVTGLANVASYEVSSRTWKPLGGGVNGPIYDLVPLTVNVSGHGVQDAIGVSGYFDTINSFGSYSSHSVFNVALWIPSLNNWLQNVDANAIALTGRLNAYASIPGMSPIWSGGVDSQMVAAGNVIGLTGSPNLKLQSLPVNFATQGSSEVRARRKRALSQEPTKGVVTGMFYRENDLNLTILAGHFTAEATGEENVSNLLVINGTHQNRITGLTSKSSTDATIFALDSQGTSLFAGGSINGGILVYDLMRNSLASSQPPSLSGGSVSVNAIATRPKSSSVYVGGSFSKAGSLSCPALCVYDANIQQWNPPGTGLSGSSTINVLQWTPDDLLILAGDLTVKGKQTTMATFLAKKQVFTAVDMADSLPGPITSYSALDSSFSSAFVAGIAKSNGSAYLASFDGDNTWTLIKGLGDRSKIEGLQILSLSSDQDTSGILGSNQVLLVTGKLHLPLHGSVSAALYDGSHFTPFALTTMSDGSPGSISQVFVQNTQNLLTPNESYLALGFIVLIGLACALGAVFLLVVLGIFVERLRRRREGYVPAPTGAMMYEKSSGGKVGTIQAEQLFGGVGPGTGEPADSRL